MNQKNGRKEKIEMAIATEWDKKKTNDNDEINMDKICAHVT